MADKLVDMAASDIYALPSNFNAQSSTDSNLADFAVVADANGDVGGGCESAAMNNRNEYSNPWGYCGTDIVSDAGTLFTTFGTVVDSKAVEEITVNFRLDAYPEGTISGHQHDDNPHETLANADVSSVIPASTGGNGVPAFFTDAGTNSSPISATVRFSLEHVDRNDADNQHWVGANKNFRADLTIEFIGQPSLTITAGWKTDSVVSSDSNSDMDTTTYTLHKYFTRT